LRSAAPDTYMVVEDVLASDEELPDTFPVQGTTGYDFIAHVDGLFVDSANEGSLTALYHAFTGESQPYSEVVRTCKHEIMTTELLSCVGDLLLMQHEGADEAEFSARFQQVTPAVMAKGVEDTAFYRYNRLVSLNEVGGDPGLFGRSVEAFHAHCLKTAEKWPA